MNLRQAQKAGRHKQFIREHGEDTPANRNQFNKTVGGRFTIPMACIDSPLVKVK
jgi:hypothetical protein